MQPRNTCAKDTAMWCRLAVAGLLAATILGAQIKKVVVVRNSRVTDEVVQQWQAEAPQVRLVAVDPNEVMQEIGDADGVVGNISPEEIQAAKNLQWMQSLSAGVERVLHLSGSTALRDSNIILTNNQIVQGPEIADHAIGMLLAHTRGIPQFLADQKTETWRRGDYGGLELRGKTAVVIGCGGIGQQIGVRAWAHGMSLIGVDPEDMPFSPFFGRYVKPDQLNEVLPEADVVFVAAPWTPESHKMMGPEQFELMKQGTYFIAVSRGGLYDMNALVKALDSRKLAGAGVDVTDPEPLPKGHPLWKFDNVIISPHVAGRSDEDRQRMLDTAKENLTRFAEGKPLINVVDKQKGY